MAAKGEARTLPGDYLSSRGQSRPLDERTKYTMRSLQKAAAAIAVLALWALPALAQENAHVMQNVSEAKWGPAPPFVPPGAQLAVLEGNPMAAVPYSVRLKFPANYSIPAHSHPTDENVTVVSGTFYMAQGDKLDRSAGHALGVGGFSHVPAKTNHFAYTKEPVTIVLHGIGPVDFNYVNPADDPRNAMK
jgi:quercetin dioxygenase-like cupin family protein